MKVDFYDLYIALCKDVSISPSKAATLMEFNRSSISSWKTKHTTPNNRILLKMTDFFNVPHAFLTQTPPFDHWKEISEDYAGFLKATGLSEETLFNSWGLNTHTFHVKEVVKFINDYIAEIGYENGTWTIVNKADANNRASRDVKHTLKALQEGLENDDIYFYEGSAITKLVRQRLIWAIQLGLDAADGLIAAEKETEQP